MPLHCHSITRAKPRCHIMLCHGFGASQHDLVDLAAWLDPEGAYSWHFPQAPARLPGYEGWAWFPRGAAELLHVLSGDYFGKLDHVEDPGLGASAQDLAELCASLGIAGDRLILGGFSQGSMVALQCVLDGRIAPRGLILLSGSLIDRQGTLARLSQATPCPVFQSHGRADPVLEIEGARELHRLLAGAGFDCQWEEFGGAHEIPFPVLEKLPAYLERLSAGLPG